MIAKFILEGLPTVRNKCTEAASAFEVANQQTYLEANYKSAQSIQ